MWLENRSEELISLDIVCLSTNIPKELVYSVVHRRWLKFKKFSTPLKDEFIAGLKIERKRIIEFLMVNAWRCYSTHTANVVLESLHSIFEEKVISKKYFDTFDKGVEWPPYSPDYFLWGYIQTIPNPPDLTALEVNLR